MAIFIVINFSALTKEWHYFWDVKIRQTAYRGAASAPTAAPTPVSTFNPASAANLFIPKIGVEAPITWSVSEDNLPDKLLEGVAHDAGTALPGQTGNIFITGHSSYYSWSSSPYKDIFALLEKLEQNDIIYIQYLDKTFTYKINETKVVSPRDLSVLEPGNGHNLTLMTCVPVGTNLNRLIISASEIN